MLFRFSGKSRALTPSVFEVDRENTGNHVFFIFKGPLPPRTCPLKIKNSKIINLIKNKSFKYFLALCMHFYHTKCTWDGRWDESKKSILKFLEKSNMAAMSPKWAFLGLFQWEKFPVLINPSKWYYFGLILVFGS